MVPLDIMHGALLSVRDSLISTVYELGLLLAYVYVTANDFGQSFSSIMTIKA